jgi:hypothetical protein
MRNYLPPGTPRPQPGPPPREPRPGHGTVWLNGAEEDSWAASWQDGDRISDSPTGTREQAIAWARAVPAARRLLFSVEADDYLELAPEVGD